MYYLYDKTGKAEFLKMGTEEDIVSKMLEVTRINSDRTLLIVHYGEETTIPDWKTYRGAEEIAKYIKDYYDKYIPQMSCVDLKREMMDIVYGKPKIKTKNRKFTKK